MTSTTSSKNKFLKMFKNIFMRNIGAFAFTQIFSLILTSSMLRSFIHSVKFSEKGLPLELTDDITFIMAIWFLFLSIAVNFFVMISSYKEIFTRRSSDFYFALPVKRETYYNASYFSSLITIAVSYLIAIGVSLFVLKSNLFVSSELFIFDYAQFVKVMMISLSAAIFALSLFAFCVVLSGRIIHYLIFCFATFYTSFIGVIAILNYLNTIWGLNVDAEAANMISPMGTMLLLFDGVKGDNINILIISLVLAAVFYALGLFVFKKRKAEVAEFSQSGKIVPAIILTISLVSIFMLVMSIEHTNDVLFIVLSVIVTLILTIVCTAIFRRKAFTKTTAISFGVATVLSIAFVVSVNTIPDKTYVKYVPETSEVQSVTFTENYNYYNAGSFNYYMSNVLGYSMGEEYQNKNQVEIKGENIENVIELHKKVVTDEVIENTKNHRDEYMPFNFEIEYKLKNGKTIKRTYSVDGQYVLDEYAKIMTNDDVLAQSEVFKYNNDDILFVVYEKSNDSAETEDYEDFSEFCTKLPFVSDNFGAVKDVILKDLKNSSSTTLGFRNDIIRKETDIDNLVGWLQFYVISEDATDEERQNLKSMNLSEAVKCYIGDENEENPLSDKIKFFSHYVYEEDENTLQFIEEYFQNK